MPMGKVLVIDDDPGIREILSMHLKDFKVQVIIAEDGEDAIRVIKEGNNLVNVAVIICDIRMPKMNGVEYIDYLIEQAPGIPVIVLTGYPDPVMANNLIEKKGVKGYLVKPIEKEKLFATVESVITTGKDFEY